MPKKRQALNPYLPCYEYIPDGEPHVFGDRVYVYGSHDRFDGNKFCMNDYVCYSADIHDLTDWRYEGVIYRKTQDPRMTDGKHQLWAPDVVRGGDGRYYLYYCPDDRIRSIGVAVCDTPAGAYEFLGLVRDEKGGIIGERPGDTIAFDPGVFLDDDGTVYLYSGNGPRLKGAIGKLPKGSRVMTLKDDMFTVQTEPKKLLPTLGESEGTGFEGHEFFEASSIRKINGRYYLVYSSVKLHELCYATSDYPDRDFVYGGVIVSNADIFPYSFDQKPKNSYGNNHGGIECIDGQYYIFYHRQTNRSMFSRQGCAEKIEILSDGSIPQVKLTSCGLNRGPLRGKGIYPASTVCHLYGKHTPVFSHQLAMGKRHPYLTQNGKDYEPYDSSVVPPRQYITNGKNGMMALFRYFDMQDVGNIAVWLRGSMRGKILVLDSENGEPVAEIPVSPSKKWKKFEAKLTIPDGERELCFKYAGKGKLDFLGFALYVAKPEQ